MELLSVEYICATKSPRGVRATVHYLRELFGPICPAVTVTSRRTSEKARKRPLLPNSAGKKRTLAPIEANCLEEVRTEQMSKFIADTVRARGLAPRPPTATARSSSDSSIGP